MKKLFQYIVMFCLIAGLVACEKKEDDERVATQQIFAMDTYMTITTYGDEAKEAAKAAVKEINRLDALLSTGRETSEVSTFNSAHTGKMSEDVAYLYKTSRELYEQTSGAFDITVYPLMKAWGFTSEEYRVPAENELAQLVAKVDCSKLKEDNGVLTLPEDVQIDFGGIAKGYTSYRLKEIFGKYKLDGAIVSLGGNVESYGTKAPGEKWGIGVQNPSTSTLPGEYIGVLELEEKAVITSGTYERFFEKDGKNYHHILDTKTGKPVENSLVSVTIVSDDGTRADGLSTALFAMGREQGEKFWREHKDEFDVIWLEKDGTVAITDGIKEAFQTSNQYKVVS